MRPLKSALDQAHKILLKPIYKLYEFWLWRQIRSGPIPRHVGIIPDGNRRWAAREGWDAIFGHERGYMKMKEVLRWLLDLNIKYVTVYAMSKENCVRRPEREKQHLFQLIKRGLQELMEAREIYERKVRVRVIGRTSLVPLDVMEVARRLEERTSAHKEGTLYIALCYGGRDEIVEAVRKIVNDVKRGTIEPESIDEEVFRRYLSTNGAPDPDLIIRTSGVERVSNFLLWQSAYSELYFTDVYWPEFRKIDLWRALRSFQMRERRFGR
uniref:Tritrans,polycis-undecaprenyl-diphosphate synthase (geranylgeranyl-diphosphate specific) n=1 Tax=Fervidicoccus fontis TaxID=683846 RepID=A0A7J3ZKF5_9CREN